MKLAILGVSAALLCGCGSDESPPVLVDVSGAWGGSVRNVSNSCPGAFNVGETNTIQLGITQDGAKVDIKIEGVVGFFVNLAFGTDTFSGSLTSDKVEASLLGRKDNVEGACTFKWTATITGSVRDGKMNGKVTYKPNPVTGDCNMISSCSRVQSFDVEKNKLLSDAGTTG